MPVTRIGFLVQVQNTRALLAIDDFPIDIIFSLNLSFFYSNEIKSITAIKSPKWSLSQKAKNEWECLHLLSFFYKEKKILGYFLS